MKEDKVKVGLAESVTIKFKKKNMKTKINVINLQKDVPLQKIDIQ